MSSYICCSGCKANLGDINDFIFFVKSDVDVHFMVAPEREVVLCGDGPRATIQIVEFEKQNAKNKNAKSAICKNCSSSVGKLNPGGPNKMNIVSMGVEKTIMLGVQHSKSDKWKNVRRDERFSTIKQRGIDDFFGTPSTSQQSCAEEAPQRIIPVMRFPDPDKPEEYLHHEILLPGDKASKILAGDYSDLEQEGQSESVDDSVNESNHTLSEAGDDDNVEDAAEDNSDEEFDENEEQIRPPPCAVFGDELLIQKTPRDYQLETYQLALRDDLIAVLPTGAGKTLIACMLLKKFKILNKERMGLFIVDRVSLADQQAKVIARETGLRVLGLTGQNKTRAMIQKLKQDDYDVLVITAGALNHHIFSKEIQLQMFCCIVFDEAHHCTGEHMYNKIIKRIHDMDKKDKPRLLGLTASPGNAETMEKAEKSIKDICEAFKSQNIFKPKIENPSANIKPTFVNISNTKTQKQFEEDVLKAYKEIAKTLKKLIPKEVKLNENIERLIYSVVKVELNAIEELPRDDNTEAREQLLKLFEILFEAQNIFNDFGLTYCLEELNDIREDIPIQMIREYFPLERYEAIEEEGDEEIISPKLTKLFQIIQGADEGSKIIVFVRTKRTARRLKYHLSKEFPALRPETVVGHSGCDGQLHAVQLKAVADFRDGRSKILVCTSVLEEGIDVPECNIVIRFDGVQSLIQFIQSRGRARMQNETSKFFILANEEESKRQLQLENHEKYMDLAIESHSKSNMALFLRIKDITLKTSLLSRNGLSLPTSHLPIIYRQESTAIELFIRNIFDEYISTEYVEEKVMEVLQPYGLVIERITVQQGIARDICPSMFDDNDFLVTIQLHDGGDDSIYLSIYNLFHNWDFMLSKELKAYTKISLKPDKRLNLKPFTGNKLNAGYFENEKNFLIKYSISSDFNIAFSPDGKYITIKFTDVVNGERVKYTMEFSLLKTACAGFSLLTTERRTVNLFLGLEAMPTLYEKSSTSNNQRVTEHELLTTLAKHHSLCLKIRVDNFQDWIQLREILSESSIFPIDLFDTKISILESKKKEEIYCNTVIPEDSMSKVKKDLLKLEWSIYMKSSDMTANVKVAEVNIWLKRLRESYINKNFIEAVRIAVAFQRAERNNTTYWKSFSLLIEKEMLNLEKLDLNIETLYSMLALNVGKFQTELYRILVTPSRYVFLPPVPVEKSRLSSIISEEYILISVVFRDENLDKSDNDEKVHIRVKDCMVNGIDIYGIRIFYLLESASQKRDQKALFINVPNVDKTNALRESLVSNFDKFTSSAKFSSRLGLFGTSVRSAGKLSADELMLIEDEKADNGCLVTDGAGFIKESKALEFCKKCEIQKQPYAMQFRWLGFKGVLVVLPDDHEVFKNKEKAILIRNSQQKFETPFDEFGIVKLATSNPVTLNRESITLLESLYLANLDKKDIWNFPANVLQHLESFLEKVTNALNDTSQAKEELMQHVDMNIIEQTCKSGFNLLLEPFFFRLLRTCYKMNILDICKRSNLPVTEGKYLMGIPDYSGKLEYTENNIPKVFLFLDGDMKPKTGLMLLYRNPCLYPGDLRLVLAVDVPELYFSKNVVILPTKNSAFSLSDNCSGGDLDGDHFTIIWDKRYVPPIETIIDPLDYSNLESDPPIESTTATSPDQLADSFINCMENDALGRIAYMHLALSDKLDDGAMNKLCKKLAEAQAIAVDYPKTGKRPKIPKDAPELVKKNGYPDFMEKRNSYPSHKTLGEMYRTSKSFLFSFDMNEISERKIPFDKSLEKEYSKETLDLAVRFYERYCYEMKRIMDSFGLEQEEEVILGRPVQWNFLLRSDKERSAKHLKQSYKSLKKKYRDYFSDHRPDGTSVKDWAAAWYRAAYDQNISHDTVRPFLSFPWIVHEVLCSIKEEKYEMPDASANVVEKVVGESAIAIFRQERNYDKEFHIDLLQVKLKEKDKDFEKIRKCINNYNPNIQFEISPYGSSSIFLCDFKSDLDIFLGIEKLMKTASDEKLVQNVQGLDILSQKRHFLKNIVCPALNQILSKMFDYIDNDIPLIKGEDEVGSMFDITCNEDGVKKTNYILNLYEKDPTYFITFWILVYWARLTGLIVLHSEETKHSVVETSAIYVFIIKMLETGDVANVEQEFELENGIENKLLHVTQTLESCDEKDMEKILGYRFHNFFRKASKLDSLKELELHWPIEGIEPVVLIPKKVSVIKQACKQAFHVLHYTRDLRQVLINAKDNTYKISEVFKWIPLKLSLIMKNNKEFHEKTIKQKTKADIRISEEHGTPRLGFTAKGPKYAVNEALNELTVLSNSNKAHTLGKTKHKSKYFVEDSMLITIRNSKESNAKVFFVDSLGSHQAYHKVRQRSNLKSKNVQNERDWNQEYDKILTEKINNQMKIFPTQDMDANCNLEITSRFGNAYVLDIKERLPKCSNSLYVEEIIERVEKSKSQRSDWFEKILARRKEESKSPMNMVDLKPISGRKQMNMDISKSFVKMDPNRSLGLSLCFNPGFFNPTKASEFMHHQELEKRISQTIQELGYVDGEISLKRVISQPYVSISIDTEDDMQLILTEDLKYIELRSRNTTYVHSTMCHGNDVDAEQVANFIMLPDHDWRFAIQTFKQIDKDSEQFRFVFPSGDTSNIPIKMENGVFKKKTDISEELSNSLLHVRKIERILQFNKNDEIGISVVRGKTFSGDLLDDCQPVLDVSQYYRPENLKEAINSGNEEMFRELTEFYSSNSLKVSDGLKNCIIGFNDWMEKQKFAS